MEIIGAYLPHALCPYSSFQRGTRCFISRNTHCSELLECNPAIYIRLSNKSDIVLIWLKVLKIQNSRKRKKKKPLKWRLWRDISQWGAQSVGGMSG